MIVAVAVVACVGIVGYAVVCLARVVTVRRERRNAQPDRTAQLRAVFAALGGPGDLESLEVGDMKLRFRAPEPVPVDVEPPTPEAMIARQVAELFRVHPQDVKVPQRPAPKQQ